MGPTPTVVDLFCGCGGISVGFHEAGYRVLGGAEILPRPLEAFQANFPDAIALAGDLMEVDPGWFRERLRLQPGELDVLVGGPPCQGWSKNVPAANRTLDDPRNRLMLRYLDFVQAFKPKALLIENVAEAINAYEASASAVVMEMLTHELGYKAQLHRVVATDYGVPQRRRRVFMVAVQPDYELPSPIPLLPTVGETTVWEAISDLPPLEIGEESRVYATRATTPYQRWVRRTGVRVVHDHFARKLTENQMRRVRLLPPGSGAGIKDLPDDVRPKMGYSGAYARLWPDEPARTITRWVFHPGSGRFLHPFDYRVITIREAARLQGFPDWFQFTGSYIEKSHMVGEAVPPLMAAAWACGLREVLGYNTSDDIEDVAG